MAAKYRDDSDTKLRLPRTFDYVMVAFDTKVTGD